MRVLVLITKGGVVGICDGRVVVVTGAGRGLGRAHALLFAQEGAKVLVNDPGFDVHGEHGDARPADEVVAEIKARGGDAVANYDSVADSEGADSIVAHALNSFGELHVLVNNAGILRDRMIFNMSDDDWDAVMGVHLKGTFLTTRAAANYWRNRQKAGDPVEANIVNTTSGSGLFGNTGQANYAAAKAGIAAMTIVAALELARYDIVVNAVAPIADTRMTTGLRPSGPEEDNRRDPSRVSPAVVWLGSTRARWLSGQVLRLGGGRIDRMQTWTFAGGADIPLDISASDMGTVIQRHLYGSLAKGARG